MIINPVENLEQFLVSGTANLSAELRDLLIEKQIPYVEENGKLELEPGLEVLDEEKILGELVDVLAAGNPPRFEIHREIGSTNEHVLKSLVSDELFICLAETQTAGKGRRGRRWVSPFGRNVYLTIGRYMRGPMSALEGLSLVIGMQAVDVLRELGLSGVGLKWPNDLLLDGGKLGGILVEIKSQDDKGIGVVMGTGINLAIAESDANQIDQPWNAAATQVEISRNELAGRFAARLIVAVEEFERTGFASFASAWQEYNLYADQTVRIIRGEEEIVGYDRGVDEYGNLLLETKTGLETHNSGEVSLRPV